MAETALTLQPKRTVVLQEAEVQIPWFKNHYHIIMLSAMAIEIFFVGVIAVLEVLTYFRR
jgi:hypothetical protein